MRAGAEREGPGDMPGWPVAFRGSSAVTAGVVTPSRLRGPGFRRVFPDTYVPSAAELTLTLRSLAACRHAAGRGVVSGYSAAELLGASCGRRDAPGGDHGGRRRPTAHPGLLVRRDRLAIGEIRWCRDVRVATPVRTAWDLARRSEPTLIRPGSTTSGPVQANLIEAVVAVDALARVGRFPPDLQLHFLNHYPRAHGADRIPEVLALADARSGSPMETRLRLLLIGAGLPRPQLQWVVQDPAARVAFWLDLAYPEHRIGVEYDGEEHTRRERIRRDIRRGTRLVDQGRRLYRYTRVEIHSEPGRIVSEVRRALARAA